jgi:hypothetical protein
MAGYGVTVVLWGSNTMPQLSAKPRNYILPGQHTGTLIPKETTTSLPKYMFGLNHFIVS